MSWCALERTIRPIWIGQGQSYRNQRQLMKIGKLLILALSLVLVVIVIVGLINFDLMLEIWVKVLIGVLFAGFIFAAVKRFSG